MLVQQTIKKAFMSKVIIFFSKDNTSGHEQLTVNKWVTVARAVG